MNTNTLKYFRVSVRVQRLAVAFLFVIANMIATFGVFAPSASAALVWEDVAVTHNTDNTPLTSSILPKGSGLLFHTVSTANLNSYTSYKLSFNYTNLNVGATNVDLYYQEQTKLGAGVGSFVKYRTAYPISAASGSVEATFDAAVASDNKLRLDIVNEDNNPWNDDNTLNPADYPNRLDIMNIRLQGQKDDGTVAVPPAPTLTSPANGASVHYDAIHNSTAKIVFTPATGVQASHVEVSGLFKNASDVEEHYTYNGASSGELEYATAGSSGHDFIVGETYSWRVRSSFESIPVSDASNSDW